MDGSRAEIQSFVNHLPLYYSYATHTQTTYTDKNKFTRSWLGLEGNFHR